MSMPFIMAFILLVMTVREAFALARLAEYPQLSVVVIV